ncbi:MAG TPA: IPT/TIG domain-containing protein [Candidatus Saccharimonadia bacterium]|nr:IPT/TIG domain-containing protein [Candidatus Saccharimonadia bacterium]
MSLLVKKYKNLNKNGFGHIELLVFLLVGISLVLLGHYIYNKNKAFADSTPLTSSTKVKIDFFGDSFTQQAEPYLLSDFDVSNDSVTFWAYGGHAICDALGPIGNLTKATAPDAAVIQFAGNSSSPCMAPYATPNSVYENKYAADLTTAIKHLEAIGTKYIVVDRSPPDAFQSTSTPNTNSELAGVYKSVISSLNYKNVVYADSADSSVLTPSGAFTVDLPCLTVEINTGNCTGPVVNGVQNNVVRSADLIHFCPISEYKFGPGGHVQLYCSVYSSGAYRYSLAIAGIISKMFPKTTVNSNISPVITSVSPTAGPTSGGTTITIKGYYLNDIQHVYFVKFYQNYNTEHENRYVYIAASDIHNISANKITVKSVNLNTFTVPDNGNVNLMAENAVGYRSVFLGLAQAQFNEQ